jgi:phosphomannomutase
MPRLFVRDKDGIQAVLLLSQIADDLKKENKTLIDRLNEIYQQYGYHMEINISKNYEGIQGKKIMSDIMTFLRKDFISKTDLPVVRVQDFKTSEEIDLIKNEKTKIQLPKSNVLKFFLDDASWVAVRPSGTEPKIKYYFSVTGKDKTSTEKNAERFSGEFFKILDENQ